MPRYFSKSWFDDNTGMEIYQPEPTIHSEPDCYDTGVLDQHGNPIFRSDKIALGFDLTRRATVKKKPGKGGKKC